MRKLYKSVCYLLIMSYLANVDAIVGRINTHPEYSSCLRTKLFASAVNSSNLHSVRLELNSEDVDEYHENPEHTLKDISDAWEYLVENGLYAATFHGLAKLIQPDLETPFRLKPVFFGQFVAAEPPSIIPDLDSLEWRLKNYQGHPIHRAVEAQVEFVRIHPYVDGNGRASRLLQNYCLLERSYPCPVIETKDKAILFQLINAVLVDRMSGKSTFYDPARSDVALRDYIAEKILDSATSIEKELQASRIYSVSIDPSKSVLDNKQLAKRVAQRIRTGARTRGLPVSAQIHDTGKKGICLEVKGNLSKSDLNESLSTCKGLPPSSYRITPRNC